jgi:hypothetical protein
MQRMGQKQGENENEELEQGENRTKNKTKKTSKNRQTLAHLNWSTGGKFWLIGVSFSASKAAS